MRQDHRPGDTLQVDYAGDTVVVMDHGQVREAQIFVACLPFSGLIYAEATWSQQVEDWLGAHVRALGYLGGVPGALVPDNLKSGVSKASFFDPVQGPSYYALARHYGTAILPTRVRKPRDKAAVESAVLQVERWILAPLRHRAFFTLAELNAAIVPLREALNQRPLAPPRTGTRRSVFEADERARLRPLPADPYTIGQWELGRAVGTDHHVIVDGHYYSVPSGLAHGRVDVFATATWCRCSSMVSGWPAIRAARSRVGTARRWSIGRRGIAPSPAAHPSRCAPKQRRSGSPPQPMSTACSPPAAMSSKAYARHTALSAWPTSMAR
jgi:hypothetical protein